MIDSKLALDVALLSTWAMTPILLAALGEILAERSGVVNIGLEGIMLISGFTAVAVADATLNPWLGVAAAIGSGALLGLIHGVISVYLKGNQIVSGVGVNLFAGGFVAYGIEAVWKVRGYYTPSVKVPKIPWLGVSPLFIASLVLVVVLFLVIYRSSLGLKLRACGENPEAADVVGVHVERIQLAATVIGAAITGLAGAVLSIDWLAAITKELPAGRGFIALALVNFANWNPLYALGGSFLFGSLWTLTEYLKNIEAAKAIIPVPLMNTIPYIATLLVTIGVIGKSKPPRSVGIPYVREGE
ncbi:MAG: ABC transporter permease [Desulfurococcus sp.]|nr:ABC transporter permease [Desulfurococcus sp.]